MTQQHDIRLTIADNHCLIWTFLTENTPASLTKGIGVVSASRSSRAQTFLFFTTFTVFWSFSNDS